MALAGLLAPFISSAQRKIDVQAHLIRGPYLQVASSSSLVIRWRTDALQRSVVNYSTDDKNLNTQAADPALTFEHKVAITGLLPRTKYYYSIGGGAGDTLQK